MYSRCLVGQGILGLHVAPIARLVAQQHLEWVQVRAV